MYVSSWSLVIVPYKLHKSGYDLDLKFANHLVLIAWYIYIYIYPKRSGVIRKKESNLLRPILFCVELEVSTIPSIMESRWSIMGLEIAFNLT